MDTALLDAIDAHAAVLDRSGHIVLVNKAWRQFYEENDGCRVAWDRLNYLDECRRSANTGDPYGHLALQGIAHVLDGTMEQFYLEYPCHSPCEKRWFAMRVTPLQVPVPGAIVLHENITETKMAEQSLEQYAEELRRSNQVLQEFAYVASHDLKEPLRKIITYGSRISERDASQLSERGRDYLHRMQDAAQRMQGLIDGLLNLSHLSTVERAYERIDLGEVVDGVLSDLELLIAETQARIEYDPLPQIEAHPTLMRQLFQNLISNSLKFRQPGVPPHIVIQSKEVWREDRIYKVSLSFMDNGIGFEPKYQDQIFAAFQRLDGHRYEGTGLGLAVCKQIVQQHNGSIMAFGRPGKGATFVVTLPYDQPCENNQPMA
ncbi:MAG: hypothetical protein OHK0039_40800 [Bacteroidia bacterium]